jgi:hypothetical protein
MKNLDDGEEVAKDCIKYVARQCCGLSVLGSLCSRARQKTDSSEIATLRLSSCVLHEPEGNVLLSLLLVIYYNTIIRAEDFG